MARLLRAARMPNLRVTLLGRSSTQNVFENNLRWVCKTIDAGPLSLSRQLFYISWAATIIVEIGRFHKVNRLNVFFFDKYGRLKLHFCHDHSPLNDLSSFRFCGGATTQLPGYGYHHKHVKF
jgi:hypothetical protein